MSLPVIRLRRWVAAGAILMIVIVAGMYLYARWRLRDVAYPVPSKLGLNIQQTAEGFSISKSDEGRTLFTVSASKVVQFKKGGKAELHDVKILIYGKDASRFDRLTGTDFEYDPGTGIISASGPVHIDLESNPQGRQRPDQTPPTETRNPIHVETNGLVFNRNTGNASASGRVMFQTPQASGEATGIQYVAKAGTLTFLSRIVLDMNASRRARLTAERAVVTKLPRVIVLTRPEIVRPEQRMLSDQATLFLRDDDTVGRIIAEGNVEQEVHGASDIRSRSDRVELQLTGVQNQLRQAILSGNVQLNSLGAQPADATAGRVMLRFAGKQVLQTVHAEDRVKLRQGHVAVARPAQATAGGNAARSMRNRPADGDIVESALRSPGSSPQDVEMTAPAMDFYVKNGKFLDRAETSGPPQILITQEGSQQKTVVTAARFTATFANNRLNTLRGEPEAKIVSSVPNQPDRVSTSQALVVAFFPSGGISSITQEGGVVYLDGTRKAWAQRATYTASDQMLVLTGSPRVADTGMTTTADVLRMNRVTGDAVAEGNVKTTYSELKQQPDGGILAPSDPIHVTSRTMTAHRAPVAAVYTGDARLWQNANVVEAPTLTFDRDVRSLTAQGNARQPVSTVLVQDDKDGKATPVTLTSSRLTYSDAGKKIVLEGGVTAMGADTTLTAQHMDVFLKPTKQASGSPSDLGTPGQVDRIVAKGNINVTQPTRRATGDQLVYTTDDEKFLLTGGPPSIFDAERGKITGDSLTFFRRDARVLVEGRETSPTVTRTRVAR